MADPTDAAAGPEMSMIDPRVMDPDSELVHRDQLSPDELEQTVAVLDAMNRWRDLERSLSEQARAYMGLGDTDMRAIRYLIAAQRHGVVATPGMIAAHLAISPAATTKLTDRLEAGGHITRTAHPDDRRRIAIMVTPETSASARASVGRSHARRFDAIAGLTSDDRAAVLRFFASLMDSAQAIAPHDDAH